MSVIEVEKTVRKPFNMPSWLFWVAALFVGGAIGNIPFVGEPIMVLLLIAALIYWLRQPKHLIAKQIRIHDEVLFQGRRSQEVVGESYRQAEIAGFVARNGRFAQARLVHEPHNVHSPGRTAVRVDLVSGDDIVTCGYIPEYLSTSVAPRAKKPMPCDAEIRGGSGSAINFGVWLYPIGTLEPRREQRRGPRFEPDEDDDPSQFWAGQKPIS